MRENDVFKFYKYYFYLVYYYLFIIGKGDLVGSDITMHLQQYGNNGGAGGGGGGTQQCGGGGANSDIIVKSSSDVRALTYCDLKCINIQGLIDCLRLYPEYQQEFGNDIQHDLTYNLREGYEAEVRFEFLYLNSICPTRNIHEI